MRLCRLRSRLCKVRALQLRLSACHAGHAAAGQHGHQHLRRAAGTCSSPNRSRELPLPSDFSFLLRPIASVEEGEPSNPIKWKAKYGGLEVSEARRLKALEAENAKLKKLLAEAMLDNVMLKDIAAKKW